MEESLVMIINGIMIKLWKFKFQHSLGAFKIENPDVSCIEFIYLEPLTFLVTYAWVLCLKYRKFTFANKAFICIRRIAHTSQSINNAHIPCLCFVQSEFPGYNNQNVSFHQYTVLEKSHTESHSYICFSRSGLKPKQCCLLKWLEP